MSNLVFLTGDFSSGSTLLFTLFRATGEYHCLYEPLHPRLREYLIWPLRVYEHHYYIKDYFSEYKGFSKIPALYRSHWATHELYLTEKDSADELYRYIRYLVDSAFERRSKVLLKFNRVNFRLPWLRSRFPESKMIHIHRDKQSQWNSIAARWWEYPNRQGKIGPDRPDFEGFNMASWCEDLKTTFPELALEHSKSGFERYSKLYDRSLAAQCAHADLSIEYRTFCKDFETQCAKLFEVAGCAADPASFKSLIVPPETQKRAPKPTGISATAADLLDRAGRKYARARLRLESIGRGV